MTNPYKPEMFWGRRSLSAGTSDRPKAEIDALIRIITGHAPQFAYWVPIEAVITRPGEVMTPGQARCYPLKPSDMALLMPKLTDKAAASYGRHIYSHYLMEYWEDWGSDGHILYVLNGWMLVKSEDYGTAVVGANLANYIGLCDLKGYA